MMDLEAHQAMGEALVSRGLASVEDVQADRAAVMADMGLEPEAPAIPAKPTAQAQDPLVLTPEDQAKADTLDSEIFAGPSSPAAYNFGPVSKGVSVSLEQEASFRAVMVQEGIPAALGSQFGKLFNAAAASPPTSADIERMNQDCSVVLHRQWGPDFQSNLNAVKAEVARIGKAHPFIIDALEISGLGSNPLVISSLFNTLKAQGKVR